MSAREGKELKKNTHAFIAIDYIIIGSAVASELKGLTCHLIYAPNRTLFSPVRTLEYHSIMDPQNGRRYEIEDTVPWLKWRR